MTEQLSVDVVGSVGTVYTITAERNGGRLKIDCTCDGARNGQACKHRIAIISGDYSCVIEGHAACHTIAGWLEGSAVISAMLGVTEAQKMVDQARRGLAAAKKGLSRAMAGG